MRGRGRAGFAFTFAACWILLLSVFAYPQVTAASTTTTTTTTASARPATPASLVLAVVPPKLPADGGSYPAVVVSLLSSSGEASLALNDTVVFLTSSRESVGSVSDRVTILRGAGFAVADFISTTAPGVTSISASSVGLGSASTQVTTVTVGGFATRLSVITIPSAQLVNAMGQGLVLVETLDSAGLPAKPTASVTVTLSSSSNSVASLPSNTLTVAGGSVFASAPYNVGFSPGTTLITASAPGFISGSGTVTVEGNPPFALKLFAQPDSIATSTAGRLIVALTGPQGDPVRAPSLISVTISSSNTSVIASDQTAMIPTGQIYAVASFSSGAAPGSANLSASSPGLGSDFSAITVVKPAQPVKLRLIIAPNPVLADGDSYNSIVVALTDAGGAPAVAQSSVAVTLTSSNAAIGSVSGSLMINSGSSYAVATFASAFSVGSTSITALAQNLQSATATVSTYGAVPTKVVVQAIPSTLPADGRNYSALEVVLEDANGVPAVAPVGIIVQLSSSSTDVVTVPAAVAIGAGQTYVVTNVVTSFSPGIATIAASSQGFQPSTTAMTTTSPAPSHLGFYIAPASGIQSLGQGGDAVIAVQLQDSNSSPAVAREDTLVVVTGSNSSMIAKPIQLDIPAGRDYAWALLTASGPGSSVLTASGRGLSSATASLTELSLPVSVTLTSSVPVAAVGTQATLLLQVDVLGSPFAGASVTMAATSGVVSPPSGVTDSAGRFTGTFIPQQKGIATITALVEDPLLGNQTAGTNILVVLPGAANTGTSTSGGLGLVGTLLPVVVVVVVVAVIAVGVRRVVKRRRRISQEDEAGAA